MCFSRQIQSKSMGHWRGVRRNMIQRFIYVPKIGLDPTPPAGKSDLK
jgi:hypothetical protein